MAVRGKRPKQSPEPTRRGETLSTRALARAIGVSESSIKRWTDDGSLRSARTVGGHRRIPRADAVRFVREHHAPVLHPEALGLVELAGSRPPALTDGGAELAELLLSGADRQTPALLTSWYLAGESLAAIVDHPLRTALERIGTLWTHDRAGIFLEHRAIQICIQALTELRGLLRVNAGAPVAVGGAVAGDPYVLPSMTAALVLAGEGIEAVNLGPDVPLASLGEAMERLDASLVWVSASVVADERTLTNDLTRLVERAAARKAHVILGGRAAGGIAPAAVPNLLAGGSMRELAAFAHGLRAAARRR